MRFKEWFFVNDVFLEFGDLAALPTDNITFELENDFDEEQERQKCHNSIDMDYSGIYDSPEDDPNFDGEDPERWEEDNPPPEDGNGMIDWEAERDEIISAYYAAKEEWEETKQRREEKAQEEYDEAIDQCVEEAKNEYENDRYRETTYVSHFEIGGSKFTVNFMQEEAASVAYGIKVKPVYEISFQGPNAFASTNMGKNQNAIYTRLMLTIKKFIETYEVNGIRFSPAEPGMGLVYHRFYKRYLSQLFIQVDSTTYIRKNVLRDALSKTSDDTKSDVYSDILSNYRDKLRRGRLVAKGKIEARELRKQFQPRLGKFVIIPPGNRVGVLKGIGHSFQTAPNGSTTVPVDVMMVANWGALDEMTYDSNFLSFPEQVVGKTMTQEAFNDAARDLVGMILASKYYMPQMDQVPGFADTVKAYGTPALTV